MRTKTRNWCWTLKHNISLWDHRSPEISCQIQASQQLQERCLFSILWVSSWCWRPVKGCDGLTGLLVFDLSANISLSIRKSVLDAVIKSKNPFGNCRGFISWVLQLKCDYLRISELRQEIGAWTLSMNRSHFSVVGCEHLRIQKLLFRFKRSKEILLFLWCYSSVHMWWKSYLTWTKYIFKQ